jgi:sugar phosphate isomerase/epimerase
MNTKLFLALTSVALLGACQSSPEAETTDNVRAPYFKGYQLYTVRESLTDAEGVRATLAATHELGYENMESFGYFGGSFFGMTPEDFHSEVEDAHLNSPSGHYLPPQLMGTEVGPIDRSTINQFLDAAEALGQHWVIIPWMSESWRNMQGYKYLVDYLRDLGEAAKARGMVAAWHNHDFEFKNVDPSDPTTSTAMEFLINSLEGSNVVFEMDIHWVAFAGENPVEWMGNYPGKFQLWHVKDFAADTVTQVPVGQGVIPWNDIFEMAEVCNLQHYFIEQDVCSADHAIDCLKESIDWAKKQPFME